MPTQRVFNSATRTSLIQLWRRRSQESLILPLRLWFGYHGGEPKSLQFCRRTSLIWQWWNQTRTVFDLAMMMPCKEASIHPWKPLRLSRDDAKLENLWFIHGKFFDSTMTIPSQRVFNYRGVTSSIRLWHSQIRETSIHLWWPLWFCYDVDEVSESLIRSPWFRRFGHDEAESESLWFSHDEAEMRECSI